MQKHEFLMNSTMSRCVFATGKRWGWVILAFQIALLWGISITYTVTGGISLQRIYNNAGGTSVSLGEWVVIFSCVSLVVSQVGTYASRQGGRQAGGQVGIVGGWTGGHVRRHGGRMQHSMFWEYLNT